MRLNYNFVKNGGDMHPLLVQLVLLKFLRINQPCIFCAAFFSLGF